MIIRQKNFGNKIPGIFEGKVAAYDNDVYMGVKLWIPGLHPEEYAKIENIAKLPTATAAAPLFGNCDGESGNFAIPQVGTYVYCFCIDGDQNNIVYFAADYSHSGFTATSIPVIKMTSMEKNIAWLKQGPAQIILRNPQEFIDGKIVDSTKVIEILTGEYGSEAASISITAGGDVEINARNIRFNGLENIDLTGPEKTAISINKNKCISIGGANSSSPTDCIVNITAKNFNLNALVVSIKYYSKSVMKYLSTAGTVFKTTIENAVSNMTNKIFR